MRVRIALAAGLALLLGALAVTLSRAPLVVGRANMPGTETEVISAVGRANVCQSREAIPSGTTAVRLAVQTSSLGAAITVKILTGARLLAEGTKEAGWRGRGVTIPIPRLTRAVADATVCLTSGPLAEPLSIGGSRISAGTGALSNGTRIPASMRIEYLQPGRRSWWSMASTVASNMGFGHAPGGSWPALLVVSLMALSVGLTVWLTLQSFPQPNRPAPRGHPWRVWRRLPAPARLCMAIAFANAACWSLITPFFQVDDEPDHVAYVQQLAEQGRLPLSTPSESFSPEESLAAQDLEYSNLRFEPETHAISSPAQQRQLEKDLNSKPSRSGGGGAGVAGSEPPLYYALQSIPYTLGSGASILVRMELMRLLSALLGAVAVLFVFLFLRELLPSTPWVWTIGTLCAALAPLLGYISGSINPDAMLATVSAAVFYCLARGFRRGLTPRLAITLGGLVAIGLLTKLNFIGLAPGVILGLALLTARAARSTGGAAWRSLALALTLAFGPLIAYILIKHQLSSGGSQRLFGPSFSPLPHGSLSGELSYLWQTYLPPLPGMTVVFPGIAVWREVWFNGLLGLYGWENSYFSDSVANAALIPVLALVALGAFSLLASRATVRAHLPELAIYLLMCAGLLGLMALASYNAYPEKAIDYRLARYLLPLLALACAGVALATRGAGRRLGPVLGALLVVMALAHDVFSQLLVIARYYG